MGNTGGKKRENQLTEKGLTRTQDEITQLEERPDETTELEERQDETTQLEERQDETTQLEERQDETTQLEERQDETTQLEERQEETTQLEERQDETTQLEERQDETTQLEERQDETTQLEGKKTEGDFIPGHHEAEICYGGEADLHKHYTGCKKNPGHVNFIPVNDFNLGHVPTRNCDVIILDVIKTLAALTVLIKVKYTSLERPKSVPFFRGQYPFYNTRGRDVLRTGTGRVCSVVKYTESDNMGTCLCGKCQNSDTPSKVWGEVCVRTATHVVFDDSEARQTKCVVGFDDNKSPGVILDGCGMGYANIEEDGCVFRCVSCDLELVDELDKISRYFYDLCENAWNKYRTFHVDKLTVIIVSHPHGCPKQVSVGQWTHEYTREFLPKYTYTTCTCPGSSGAHVYMPGYDASSLRPHSGSNSEGNFSGEGGWLFY